MKPLIVKFLKATRNQIHINEFENLYSSHPNYPSLLSVTDSLTQIGVENMAAKVPFRHFDQLPATFFAELEFKNKDFYLVEKRDNNVSIEDEKESFKLISKEDLEKHWTGLILAIDEAKSNEQKLNYIRKGDKVVFLMSFLVLFSYSTSNLSFIETLYLIFVAVGLVLSLKICENYFQINNEIESKLCSLNQNFSCKNIINTKSYSFSKYIEFVDMPILFYSVAFLSQILGIQSMFYFGVVSLISVPILIYSIYLQGFVFKKWCVLCLSIALTNLLIALIFILNFNDFAFSKTILFQIFVLSITVALVWFSIKKQILNANEKETKLNGLLRFKRNEEVFESLSKDLNEVDLFKSLAKIQLGNPDAKNTITLFLSPSCPHCHTAYQEALDLIKKNPEQVNVEIGYNININNLDNPYLDVAKTIFSLYNAQKDFKQALDDWHLKNMKLDHWLSKWKEKQEFMVENNQLETQLQWCMKNDLNFAPVKIFNQRMMHRNYQINELFYFFES